MFRPSNPDSVDGLQPGYLKDLVAPQTAEAGRRLLNALTGLCSNHIRGIDTFETFFLQQMDGGIRHVTVRRSFVDLPQIYRRSVSYQTN